jgi:phosphoribosylglycinamide formyltransferase-1
MSSSQSYTKDQPKIVILISGSGSNMVAIANNLKKENVEADIVAVISNMENADGLKKAADLGITTEVVKSRFLERDEFDNQLLRAIEVHAPDLVVLAGFMRILTPKFTRYFEGRLINIHPSLLPKHKGLHTHKKALKSQDVIHGTTVHFVTEELDDGPNIIQAIVPIDKQDTESTLQKKVLVQEHIIYSIAIKWFVEGRISMKNNIAYIDNQTLPLTGLQLNTSLSMY